MRIGFLFVLLCLCYVPSGECKNHCKRKVKRLENRVKKLENRLDRLEKGFCNRSNCPKDFVHFKNYCLLFVVGNKMTKTWHQSHNDCKKKGTELVTIISRKKERFIAKYIRKHFPDMDRSVFYTGLIVSDETTATTPFKLNPQKYSSGEPARHKSIRWSSNNQSINTSNITYKDNQKATFANWSPRQIQGSITGPINGVCYHHHCVTISATTSNSSSSSKLKLIWQFSCCDETLNYICEFRKKSICD